MISPLPHQHPAIARHVSVLSRHVATVDGSIPGFGKTYVCSFVAKELGLRPAVLCPKAVIPHWNRALEQVGVAPVFVTNYEQARLPRFPWGGWEIRRKRYDWSKLPADALLVFDEGHRCKDRTTQNAKFMTCARRQSRRSMILSATLALDPLDLYAPGYLLELHDGLNFLPWTFQFGVTRGRFDWEYRGGPDGLRRLNSALYPEHGYRATYEDLPDFPEHTLSVDSVPVSDPGALCDLWDDVRRLQALEGEAVEAVTARLRARQWSELGKLPSMLELAEEALRGGETVILFVTSRESAEWLRQSLVCPVIWGGQSAGERQTAIDNFQSNACRVLVAQIQSGGVGVSLHDTHGGHPRLALISPPESARDLVQALGRHHRATARTPARSIVLTAEGTVESKVQRALEKKVHQISLINDGDLDPLFS